MKTIKRNTFLNATIFILILSCSSPSKVNNCLSASAIDVGFSSCLFFEGFTDSDARKDTIEIKIKETLTLVNTKMSIENLIVTVRLTSSGVIPEIGIGGINPNKNEINLSIDPYFENLEESLLNELPPLFAHEIHHAKRRRAIGYGSTLLEAAISEGLADSFSIELFNIDIPLWASALSEDDVDQWIENASKEWNNPEYNHSEWFFGTGSEVPRWTGYSIGFKLANDFISENEGLNASKLYSEPASSFVN